MKHGMVVIHIKTISKQNCDLGSKVRSNAVFCAKSLIDHTKSLLDHNVAGSDQIAIKLCMVVLHIRRKVACENHDLMSIKGQGHT